jgi:hypothetical protein
MILTGRGADMAQHRGGFKVKVATLFRVDVPHSKNSAQWHDPARCFRLGAFVTRVRRKPVPMPCDDA